MKTTTYKIFAEDATDGKRRFLGYCSANSLGFNNIYDMYADKCDDQEEVVISKITRNEYKVVRKDADDKLFTNYKKAVKYAKEHCGWDHPVTVIMNGKKIHSYEEGYGNYIFDKIAS